MDPNVKVLVVDDSPAVQSSSGGLLAAVPHVDLVGSAGDAGAALALIDALLPDLVVLDVELRNGENGLHVLQHVVGEHPRTQVVVLSNSPWPQVRKELLAAGAQAYFDKSNEFMPARDWIAAQAAGQAARGATTGPQ